MFYFIISIYYIFRNFLIINIHGSNFILRKIPYIGFLFSPFALLGLHNSGKKRGEQLRYTLQKLGPTFIKLGQLLSTRSDIVGKDFAKDLADLQDRLPPFDFSYVKQVIKLEFGEDVETLFREIEKEPCSAASISQVHKAVSHEGNIIAVKILRPGIRRRFLREVRFLYVMAVLLDYFKRVKRLKLKQVVKIFQEGVEQELDLRFEAASADQLKENLASDKNIYIPKVFWNFTAQRVLCTEWIEGYKIDELKMLHNQLESKELIDGRASVQPPRTNRTNQKKIAENLLNCYFVQAYQYGFFHADMHPGNIIIMPDGRIAFIDFGIMGKLSDEDRIYVTQIIYGFVKRDYNYIAKMHYLAGYIPKETNLKEFSLACRSIGEPIFGLAAKQISLAKMLAHLFQVTEKYGMETQPQLLLLQKTLVIVEGVGFSLDPDLNMWKLGEPWLKNWAKENLNLGTKVKEELSSFCETMQMVPRIMHNVQNISDNFVHNMAQQKSHSKVRVLYLVIGVLAGCLTTTLLTH